MIKFGQMKIWGEKYFLKFFFYFESHLKFCNEMYERLHEEFEALRKAREARFREKPEGEELWERDIRIARERIQAREKMEGNRDDEVICFGEIKMIPEVPTGDLDLGTLGESDGMREEEIEIIALE